MLFSALVEARDEEAIRFGERTLTWAELAGAAGAVARELESVERVALWAVSELETCVAVLGALVAGVPVVPLNPNSGRLELEHVMRDSRPGLVLAQREAELPEALSGTARLSVDVGARATVPTREPAEDSAALVIYTSGTTGLPKGAVLPRRAISSNLDALADAWEWTDKDALVHALPLFHAHGLVLGVLGPVRRGGRVEHIGHFSSKGLADALVRGGTMVFGVPTMYHRLAADAESDPDIAGAVGRARLLVSGSAPLSAADHRRISKATGQKIVERYGMTETLMNTSVRASGERRAGYVGPPLDGVEIVLFDDDGEVIDDADDETMGEIGVRGPNLFTEYLNRPDATDEAMRGGWFQTGDLATRASDGYIRIVGRRATDLIKSGGYKIGAGEIEMALLDHDEVAEAAVTGEPDDDLGERIVAWIVPTAGCSPSDEALSGHVADLLSPHKRPRTVHLVEELPRNEMGKLVKRRLHS